MDQPKLTLVLNNTTTTDAAGGDGAPSDDSNNCNGENAWFDACDLEGVDVEEVDEENVGYLIIKEKEWSEEQGHSSEEDGDDEQENFEEDGQIKAFEYYNCSECDMHGCSRPVKEICGHVKCRSCFVASGDGCKQCLTKRVLTTEHKHNKSQSRMEEDLRCSDKGNGNEERVVIKPNEYIFELGETSGCKSIAVVSSETLKELGIQQGVDSITNENVDVGRSENVEKPSSQGSTNEEIEAAQSSDASREQHSISLDKKKVFKKKVFMNHITVIEPESESSTSELKKYKCLKCDVEFSHEYKRKYHVYCDPRNGRRPFVCHCSEEFVSQSHYMYHVRSKHTGEKPYECPVCSARFIQKVKLNRHMVTHTSKPIKRDSSTYLCAYCKKRFNSLASCRRHIRNHTDDRPFTCSKCDKSFKQKYSLDLHERTHLNQRPFKCPDCDKAFSTAKDMRRHHLCHTGELPFECAFKGCGAKFRRKDNLERHIRQTHNLTEKMARVLGNEAAKKYEDGKANQDVQQSMQEKGKKAALKGIVEVITGL